MLFHPHAARLAALSALVAAALSTSAGAQVTLLTGDHSIDGRLCVGGDCSGTVSFGVSDLKVTSIYPYVMLDDSSAGPSGSTTDWAIRGNDSSLDFFGIENLSTNAMALRIDGTSPASSLTIGTDGNVGLGTALPQTDLHIVSSYRPSITLEQDALVNPPYKWEIRGSDVFYSIWDGVADKTPLIVAPGTPSYMMGVFPQQVGIGGAIPYDGASTLHVKGLNGTTAIKVEEIVATTSPRTLLNLVNNGRPEIVMANTDTGGEWSFGAGTNFILKQGTVGSASNTKTKLFEIDPAGNATLTGSLVTGGTTCGSGCDAVFRDDYALPSIPDHAARMQALGYLPNVGPTPEGAPFDVTDKLGRMLNELEHAHLYIAELERETRQIPALRETARRLEADNAALAARLERLETALLPAAD